MGLKNIFNHEDDERIVVDKQRKLIRMLIIAVVIVVFLMIAILLVAAFINNDQKEYRIRVNWLSNDIINLSNSVLKLGQDNRDRPEDYPLIGRSLAEEPYVINVNGQNEEYKYGYYYLTAAEVNQFAQLNYPDEDYIVNYDTGDVININGVYVKESKKTYYSLDDIKALKEGRVPISDTTVNIASVSDLEAMRRNPNGNFKLISDIDMSTISSGDGWAPIENFGGTFDGRGYSIYNLTISRPMKTNCGLFAEITSSAILKNINLVDVKVNGGNYTGALVGASSGRITNCSVTGNISSISGEEYVGGLVGSFNNSTLSNSYVEATVNGSRYTGGLAGALYQGTITQCYAKGEVNSTDTCGGLIGRIKPNNGTTYFNESYADTSVVGKDNVGGLIGQIEIVDASKVDIINVYAKGMATSEGIVGGFVGKILTMNIAEVSIVNSYTTVAVDSLTRGGFVGEVNVSVGSNVITNNCFWQKDYALDYDLKDVAKTTSAIQVNIPSKTYEEMITQVTFGQWDFIKVWNIEDRVGYPFFRWEER